MARRYQPVIYGSADQRQFHSLTDVRKEMVALYWQIKHGKVDKGAGPTLAKLLDMIAHYMVETEAEIQAKRLREQIEEARQELLARGISVPTIIDVVPERIS